MYRLKVDYVANSLHRFFREFGFDFMFLLLFYNSHQAIENTFQYLRARNFLVFIIFVIYHLRHIIIQNIQISLIEMRIQSIYV